MHLARILTAMLLLSITSCGGVMERRQITSGNLDQVEQKLSGSTDDGSLVRLKNRCIIFYTKKKFAQFDACFSQYRKRFTPARNGLLFLSDFTGAGGQDDFSYWDLYAMEAELALALQKYRRAIDLSYKSINELTHSQMHITFQRMALLTTFGLPSPLLTGAVAAIRAHRPDDYKEFMDALNELGEESESFFRGNPGLAREYHMIQARILYENGEYQKARSFIDKIQIGWLEGKFDYGDVIRVYKSALEGKIYFALGDYEKAGEAYGLALKNPHFRNLDSSMIWQSYHQAALIERSMGDDRQAIDYLREAIREIESQRASIHAESGKIGFAGDKQRVYSDIVTALMDEGAFDEAFAYAERGKARALVDMLASKKKFAGGGEAASVEEQNRLLAQLDAAEVKAYAMNSGEAERSSTRSIAIKARTTLAQQAPELSSLVTVEAPDVKEIQRLLPKAETLIEYYGSGDDLFAFVVTAEGIRGVKLNGKGLDAEVRAFRQAILDVKSPAYRQSGQRLYARLIAPVASGIHTKNLTIVPHGALHYLPFAALTDGGQFLIDRYNVRILPSASVMKFLKAHRNKAGSMLAFGNPDLGDAKYDLPFAQKEAQAVSSEVPGAKLLLRGQATETAVKAYGKAFRYLHFASHGVFNPEKPLQSGLLLAKDDQNDGMLTVGELYDLNLNADLVTLSACETALGKVANGDDVVGFTRGFLYAGASSIVSSLWQVDDAATSDLMTGFYKNLAREDKRAALRDAQLATKAKYHHPYYWAAFQMTGAVE
ncbi:MAG: CHAT domain-containing protein [Gammaproteobacteria bacterium]|nr:MAG: CHAT domain-containing protein [Gammaproteobacteria bacterium]